MYKHYYDELLFKYKLIHSKRLRDVYSDIPHIVNANIWNDFEQSSEILNSLVFKILQNMGDVFKDYEEYIPYFKFKKEILELRNPIMPMLWTRYDGFIRNNGEGIFFSEFNYDKPCAQRECIVMGKINCSEENINRNYEEELIKNIFAILEKYFGHLYRDKRICFLVGNTSYEENHLAILLKSMLKAYGIKCIIAAPENIDVIGERVYAFDTNIELIIRLFPGESLYKIDKFKQLLELFEKGKFAIINDPRMVFIQNKALYAYLWKLTLNNDKRLSNEERNVIKRTLPYTEILNEKHKELVLGNKDKYVIKPSLGRYSEDVYIGKLFSKDQWRDIVESIYTKNKEKAFILQEFCEIKAESSVYCNGVFRKNIDAYGNYGIFMMGNKVSGCCVRWTTSYLTSEEGTWITPVIKKQGYINKIKSKVLSPKLEGELILKGGFSGIYCREKPYIDGSNYEIDKELYEKIVYATEKFSEILEKTYKFAINNLNGISPILSIEDYVDVIIKDRNPLHYFISRLDWAIDRDRNIKLLEVNSETPAGICECAFLEELIKEDKEYRGVNEKLKNNIRLAANKIIDNYKEYIKYENNINIAFLTLTYYEDFITTRAIKKMLKDISYTKCIIGNIYDLEEREDGVYLYGEKIHIIYRYYPLQWIYEEPKLKWLARHINEDVFFINSPKSIITQSKGFLAIIHELLNHKFYTEDESVFIKKYIPYTTYDMENIKSNDFVIKPLLEREGQGVRFSSDISEVPQDDVVFQERVFMEPIYDKFLVFGAYMIQGKFSGIYCREGKEITTNECRWISLYIKKG